MPLVTVVVAAYNATDTLERAVRSVTSQTHQEWELLVVDDCSTDDTAALAHHLAEQDARVRVIAAPSNGGPAAARNLALEQAGGEWITYLDSDDEFTPTRLADMLAAAGDDVDVVVCRHEIVAVGGEERVRGHAAATLTGADALRELLLNTTSPYLWDKMFRRRAVGQLRFVDVRRAEDKIYVAAALRAARRVRYLDDALYRYYVSPTSLTWGRVADIAETRTLNAAVADAAGLPGPHQRVSDLVAWVEAAHQAINGMPRREAIERVRACGAEYAWRDVRAAARRNPVFAAMGAAVKATPALYARVYGSYSAKALEG